MNEWVDEKTTILYLYANEMSQRTIFYAEKTTPNPFFVVIVAVVKC